MLWSKLRCLLQSPTDVATIAREHSVDDFANYFIDKIENIRQSTVSASPPVKKTGLFRSSWINLVRLQQQKLYNY